MIKSKKLLALLPARGGSKRLPGKNIRLIDGVPLIELTIRASLQSQYIDYTMVSTDSAEIATVARSSGAEVPFYRPDRLSRDTSTSVDTAIHALDELQSRNMYFDYLVLLQPTSPLRTEKHKDEAVELLIQKEADAIVSVTDLESTAEWSGPLNDDLQLPWLAARDNKVQNTINRVKINGAIYLINSEQLIRGKTFFLDEKIYGLRMTKNVSIDIDTKLDFDIAEFLLKHQSK